MQRCFHESTTLCALPHGVSWAVLSRDGTLLATADKVDDDDDAVDHCGAASIFDAETGKLVARLLTHTEGHIHHRPGHHQEVMTAIAFSPDGSCVATAAEDGSVAIWSTESEVSAEASAAAEGHVALLTRVQRLSMSAIEIAPDEMLAKHAADLMRGAFASIEPSQQEPAPEDAASSVPFPLLPPTQPQRQSTFTSHTSMPPLEKHPHHDKGPTYATSVRFSHDGRFLASTSWGHGATIYDMADMAKRTTRPIAGPLHNMQDRTAAAEMSGLCDDLHSCSFSPNDEFLATCGEATDIVLWSTSTWTQHAILTGVHVAGTTVNSAEWSRDGASLVSAGADGYVVVWDVQTRQPRGVLYHGGRIGKSAQSWCVNQCASAEFSSDGRYIVSACSGGFACVWCAHTFERFASLPTAADTVECVAFVPPRRSIFGESTEAFDDDEEEGDGVMTVGSDGHVLLWRPRGARVDPVVDLDAIVLPQGVARPKRHLLNNSDVIRALRSADVTPAERAFVGPAIETSEWGITDSIKSCAFSPDGHHLITAQANVAIVWSAATLQERGRCVGHPSLVSSACFSHHESGGTTGEHRSFRRICTGSSDGTARVWNSKTYECIAVLKGGHTTEGYDVKVEFSRDDKWIVTTADDSIVVVWDSHVPEPESSDSDSDADADAASNAHSSSADMSWVPSSDDDDEEEEKKRNRAKSGDDLDLDLDFSGLDLDLDLDLNPAAGSPEASGDSSDSVVGEAGAAAGLLIRVASYTIVKRFSDIDEDGDAIDFSHALFSSDSSGSLLLLIGAASTMTAFDCEKEWADVPISNSKGRSSVCARAAAWAPSTIRRGTLAVQCFVPPGSSSDRIHIYDRRVEDPSTGESTLTLISNTELRSGNDCNSLAWNERSDRLIGARGEDGVEIYSVDPDDATLDLIAVLHGGTAALPVVDFLCASFQPFGRGKSPYAVTGSEEGHLFFWSLSPANAAAAIDLLRGRDGQELGFIEITSSAMFDPGEDGASHLSLCNGWRRSGESSTDGSALHCLARGHDKSWLSEGRYFAALELWAQSAAPYIQLTDGGGLTPLEVAVEASNFLFVEAVFKNKLVVSAGFDEMSRFRGGGVRAAKKSTVPFVRGLLLPRELVALIDSGTFTARAIDYLREDEGEPLLLTAPASSTRGLPNGCFDFAESRSFEVLGEESGVASASDLWRHFHVGMKGNICSRLGCGEGGTQRTQADALLVGMKGVADSVDGRRLLHELVQGGAVTLDAFDSHAIRAVIMYKWRTFGQRGYTCRLVLFGAHLLFHTIACRNRYALIDRPIDVIETHSPLRLVSIKTLCALLIVSSIGWLIDEAVQLRGSLSAGNDDIVDRIKREPLALLRDAIAEYVSRARSRQCPARFRPTPIPPLSPFSISHRSAASSIHSACLHQTRPLHPHADPHNLLPPSVRYFDDAFNWIDLVSILTTILAMAYGLGNEDRGELQPQGVGSELAIGPSLMAVANLLCWARLFDAVRGVDGIAFYPYLLTEVIKDLVGFSVILLAVLLAFTVSMQALAQPSWVDHTSSGSNGSAVLVATAHSMQFFPTAVSLVSYSADCNALI